MKCLACCVVLSVAVLLAGCGKGGGSAGKAPPPAAGAAKAVLEEVAKTGEITSGFQTVGDYVETLKKTDAAKGEALSKELQALSTTVDTAARKAKAKELADKL